MYLRRITHRAQTNLILHGRNSAFMGARESQFRGYTPAHVSAEPLAMPADRALVGNPDLRQDGVIFRFLKLVEHALLRDCETAGKDSQGMVMYTGCHLR